MLTFLVHLPEDSTGRSFKHETALAFDRSSCSSPTLIQQALVSGLCQLFSYTVSDLVSTALRLCHLGGVGITQIVPDRSRLLSIIRSKMKCRKCWKKTLYEFHVKFNLVSRVLPPSLCSVILNLNSESITTSSNVRSQVLALTFFLFS